MTMMTMVPMPMYMAPLLPAAPRCDAAYHSG